MAVYELTSPTGEVYEVTAPDNATEEQVYSYFSNNIDSIKPAEQTPAPKVPESEDGSDTINNYTNPANSSTPLLDTRGSEFLEPLGTIVTGAVAEPIAGLAGIAQALNPFADEGAGADAVERTRDALTYIPKTEKGRGYLEDVGGFLAPVGKMLSGAEEYLGDNVFKATGSPTLSAAATTIPTAVMELIGVGAGSKAMKAGRMAQRTLIEGKIARELADAAPTSDQLKEAARGLYKEIDDTGAVVKPEAFTRLTQQIAHETKKAGIDKTITPKATQALKRFEELQGQAITITELDTLRKVAQNAAKSIEPSEKALGITMANAVDDFLDKSSVSSLIADNGKGVADIGKKYKFARKLWGSARKSEMVQEAFEKARNQASGFENGIRVQFRSILNDKKKRNFFNSVEVDAMKKVVNGDAKQNLAKLIGRFGFTEGGATNIVGGALGATAGAVAFGTPGAVIVPIVGQVSRKLAQRMTAKGAEFVDQVIRAGKDGRKIADAYIRNTPKQLRTPQELSELLTRYDIDLTNIPSGEVVDTAVDLAKKRRLEMAGALAPQAANGER